MSDVDPRLTFVRNHCLYLGRFIVCDLRSTPPIMITFHLTNRDLGITEQELFALKQEIKKYYLSFIGNL